MFCIVAGRLCMRRGGIVPRQVADGASSRHTGAEERRGVVRECLLRVPSGYVTN